MKAQHPVIMFVLALSSLLLSGCSLDFGFGDQVSGSGNVETRLYDVDDFVGIDIGSAFEGVIVVDEGAQFDVQVTADDNFFEHLRVDVNNDVLRIKTDDGTGLRSVTELAVEITLPALKDLDVSGASEVSVEYLGKVESEVSIDASGASDLTIDGIEADQINLDLSGASNTTINGMAATMEVDLSGASNLDLGGMELTDVNVDLSGASSMELGPTSSVTGDLSGASSLDAPDVVSVSVEVSGSSSVDRG